MGEGQPRPLHLGETDHHHILEVEMLENTEYLYEQTKQARALVDCGHLDFTSRKVRESSGWFVQCCLLYSLSFGPTACALIISVLCLFDFSILSIFCLILALRCFLGSLKHDRNIQRSQKKRNRRFMHLFAYTFFMVIIRVAYEFPLILSENSRSAFAISFGFLKQSVLNDELVVEQAASTVYSITIAIFSLTFCTPHNHECTKQLLLARAEMDNMAAFKLATATLAKVEFQRDDELELISQRIHALQVNVQNLQSHSLDQTKIDQEIDRYLLDHDNRRKATNLVFHRSGKLSKHFKRQKLRTRRLKMKVMSKMKGRKAIYEKQREMSEISPSDYEVFDLVENLSFSDSTSYSSKSGSEISGSGIDHDDEAGAPTFVKESNSTEGTPHNVSTSDASQPTTLKVETGSFVELSEIREKGESSAFSRIKPVKRQSSWSPQSPRTDFKLSRDKNVSRGSVQSASGRSTSNSEVSTQNVKKHAIQTHAKNARETMMRGITKGLDTIAQSIKDAHDEVEAASAPNVGRLHGTQSEKRWANYRPCGSVRRQ